MAINSGQAPRGKRKLPNPQEQVIAEAKQRQYFTVREEFVRKYHKSKHPDFCRAAEYHAHLILHQKKQSQDSENDETDILENNIINIDESLEIYKFQSVPWYNWYGFEDWPQPTLLLEEFTQQYREYKVCQERKKQHRLGRCVSPGTPGQRAHQHNLGNRPSYNSHRIRKPGQNSKPTICVRPIDVVVVTGSSSPIVGVFNPLASPPSASSQQQDHSSGITHRTDLHGRRGRYRSVKAARDAIAKIHIRNRIKANEGIIKALSKGGLAAAYKLKQRLHQIPFLGDILGDQCVEVKASTASRPRTSPTPSQKPQQPQKQPPSQQRNGANSSSVTPPVPTLTPTPAAAAPPPVTAPRLVPQIMTKTSEQIWEEFVTKYGYSESMIQEWHAKNAHLEQATEMLNRWYEHVWGDYEGQI
ncbi:hypothetical protein VTN49DRAFT_1269 [Thermomyces lanuginosus]|uniref:uncharacterized protein n=1 Tax=Thermomyces lanuginosus TaxID=5541 RepID=UPI003742855D